MDQQPVRSERRTDRGEESVATEARTAATSSLTDTTAFRIGRLVYGGILAFMAIDNLRNFDEMVGYAESKGAPMPETAVPAISGSLLAGGIGIALWRFPRAAASAVAAFFLTVTPVMHDFWALDDEEQAQQQQIHFMKNGALLGAALAFLGLGSRESSDGPAPR